MSQQIPHVSQWRTSSYSGGSGTSCVQIAAVGTDGPIATRDSKDPGGPVLGFTRAEWRAFLGEVKRGRLDLA